MNFMLHEFCFNLKRKTVSSQGQAIVLTPAKDRPPPPATTLLSEMNPPHPLAPQLPRGPAVPPQAPARILLTARVVALAPPTSPSHSVTRHSPSLRPVCFAQCWIRMPGTVAGTK